MLVQMLDKFKHTVCSSQPVSLLTQLDTGVRQTKDDDDGGGNNGGDLDVRESCCGSDNNDRDGHEGDDHGGGDHDEDNMQLVITSVRISEKTKLYIYSVVMLCS